MRNAITCVAAITVGGIGGFPPSWLGASVIAQPDGGMIGGGITHTPFCSTAGGVHTMGGGVLLQVVGTHWPLTVSTVCAKEGADTMSSVPNAMRIRPSCHVKKGSLLGLRILLPFN